MCETCQLHYLLARFDKNNFRFAELWLLKPIIRAEADFVLSLPRKEKQVFCPRCSAGDTSDRRTCFRENRFAPTLGMKSEETIAKEFPLHYFIWKDDATALKAALEETDGSLHLEQLDPRGR